MRIHRSRPDQNFTILPNETLRDQRLSYTARGVLVELLSHVDGWETNADALSELARRHRGSKTGEGRRAIRAAFTELEQLGYLVRHKQRAGKGRFVTTLALYDTPGHSATDAASVAKADVWAIGDRGTADGTSVHGTSVDGMSVSGTSIRSTNQRSTDEEAQASEDSAEFADAHPAALAAREKRLDLLFTTVNHLSGQALRDCLLQFERHRPKIYRNCRKHALAQLEGADTRILNEEQAHYEVDRLSLQYGVLHYEANKNWPGWMIKPLEEQYQRDRRASA